MRHVFGSWPLIVLLACGDEGAGGEWPETAGDGGSTQTAGESGAATSGGTDSASTSADDSAELILGALKTHPVFIFFNVLVRKG